MGVYFYSECSFNLPQKRLYKKWLTQIIETAARSIDTLNYIFCDDAYLFEINRSYLNHDDYTDIITFDYQPAPQPILADIYISVERVQENASQLHLKDWHEELHRVMAHGVLHILGHKDKTPKEAALMRLQENKCIELFNALNEAYHKKE